MISEKLKEEVKKEALRLKKTATQEERDRLDFRNLNPLLADQCIYGEMTGNCYSDRAKELFDKCATPYSSILEEFPQAPLVNSYCDTNKLRVGAHSAIEYYIYQEDANPQALVDYLQDKTQTLEI